MTDEAYIVANEQQEREVLYKLEQEDITWWVGDKLTQWTPSRILHVEFPYILLAQETFVTWSRINEVRDLEKYEIVFDGRKESKMKISKEVYDALVEWRDEYILNAALGRLAECVDGSDLSEVPEVVINWWVDKEMPIESNNRLIAIIRWVNGEDVFEVEKPKKWVVRSKETDIDGDYRFVVLKDSKGLARASQGLTVFIATKFDTKEEAESWANAHQEVIEVEE